MLARKNNKKIFKMKCKVHGYHVNDTLTKQTDLYYMIDTHAYSYMIEHFEKCLGQCSFSQLRFFFSLQVARGWSAYFIFKTPQHAKKTTPTFRQSSCLVTELFYQTERCLSNAEAWEFLSEYMNIS